MDEHIIDSLMRAGNTYELIIALVLIILIGFFRRKLIQYLISIYSSLQVKVYYKEDPKDLRSLKHHDIFKTIERVRRTCNKHRFYCGKEYDNTKSQMFSDFMNFKLDSVKRHFKTLIINSEKAVDNDHLKDMCFTAVGDSITEYIEATRVYYVKKGISYKDADYVVDLFERWRLETVSSVQNRINSVFASKFHKNKYQNLLAVLELISMAIDLIPKDGVAAFNSFNGKFKNLKYTSERNK